MAPLKDVIAAETSIFVEKVRLALLPFAGEVKESPAGA
jgi:hypothetical protein